jgi:hypothetical protein
VVWRGSTFPIVRGCEFSFYWNHTKYYVTSALLAFDYRSSENSSVKLICRCLLGNVTTLLVRYQIILGNYRDGYERRNLSSSVLAFVWRNLNRANAVRELSEAKLSATTTLSTTRVTTVHKWSTSREVRKGRRFCASAVGDICSSPIVRPLSHRL